MEHIDELYEKFLQKRCSPEELETLLAYFRQQDNAEHIQELIQAALEKPVGDRPHVEDNAIIERNRSKLNECIGGKQQLSKRLSPLYKVAAAAVLIALGGWFYWSTQQSGSEVPLASLYGDDALPGGNRATLTLTDGRTIDLSEAQEGIVVGDEISYTDGSAVYNGPSGTEKGSLTTNYYVLSTPKGGTYQVTLPDGSKVWLNSASILKYPSKFDDKERVVELVGEGYFEVNRRQSAQSAFNLPFKVITNGQTVEVLGTQFNISAYADEKETRTTLVEGSVRLSLARELSEASLVPDKQVVLAPGEQGIVTPEGLSKQHVDTEPYTAWKNGRISFNDQPIDAIMRGVARWYDVAVVYEGELPEDKFGGTVSRFDNVSSVLRTLELTGRVRFRVEGRTIYVSK